MSDEQDIARVRSFNRLVTRQVGALERSLPRPAPARGARVLFEIGSDGATPRDVRARLGLDSGYLSRMIGSLERDGLVEKRPNPADRRTKRLCLTPAGRSSCASSIASPTSSPRRRWRHSPHEQRARLLRAQAEVRHLLAISMVEHRARGPVLGRRAMVPGPLLRRAGRALRGALRPRQHAARRRRRPGAAQRGVPDRSRQRTAGGVRGAEDVKHGEMMRMWVDRPHRGLGIGARMLKPSRSRRWRSASGPCASTRTDRSPRPRRCTARRGYVEIARYNDDPYANHWFEKRLVAG